VGPGLGSLTLGLLNAVDRVVAVEIDPRLAALLPKTVSARLPDRAERLTVVQADALRIQELPGPPPTALVANLPYNIAVPVLLNLLELLPSLDRALVLVQAEVAERLAAPPGGSAYGVPSVKAAWYGEVRRAGAVGRKVFWPEPNVDSGLVALVRRRRATASLHSRSSTPLSPPAARACVPGWPAGPAARRRPRRACAPPASTPRPGASSCRSPTSPGWRRPSR
jgi:16S rRNA (adenine1518-N6/adenine1519-N6)-dimethyltransferase